MTQRGRTESGVRDWIDSHLAGLDAPPARLAPAPKPEAPVSTVRDPGVMAAGCTVRELDFDDFDTIPAELETLLNFSETKFR
jgi:hypothetical protein